MEDPAATRIASEASTYWDANREKSKDPAYWMAHPLCRQAINRRVTGDPNEWPLDCFKRIFAATPFDRGISWGCGLGAFERGAIRIGLVREIDGFDISPASLEDARREALKEGIDGIHYALGDFDDPTFDRRGVKYDIVFFHASLHHVSSLERLFRRLALGGLRPGGALYLDEYIGPSRFHWTQDRLLNAQAVLDLAPASAKINARILPPVEVDDPSEAVRSDEIPGFVREFFDIVAWQPYGGQLAGLVFPQLHAEWVHSDAGQRFVSSLLEMEDEQLQRDPTTTAHVVAYARLKPVRRLLRPIGAQTVRALLRRAVSVTY